MQINQNISRLWITSDDINNALSVLHELNSLISAVITNKLK